MKAMSLEDIEKVAAGDTITLVRPDGQVDVWTRHDDGLFVDVVGTRLPITSFHRSVETGKVFHPVSHNIGDGVQTTDGRVHIVIAKDHDREVWATFGDRFGWVENTTVPKYGSEYPVDQMTAFRKSQVGLATEAHRAMVLSDRLDAIIESGEIPESRTMVVSVEVEGTAEVAPSEAQVRRMLKTTGLSVTDVPKMKVGWRTKASIEAETRWDCACDTVNSITDLEGNDFPGEVTSFRVVGCVPKLARRTGPKVEAETV